MYSDATVGEAKFEVHLGSESSSSDGLPLKWKRKEKSKSKSRDIKWHGNKVSLISFQHS
jgi:hypothetical protein